MPWREESLLGVQKAELLSLILRKVLLRPSILTDFCTKDMEWMRLWCILEIFIYYFNALTTALRSVVQNHLITFVFSWAGLKTLHVTYNVFVRILITNFYIGSWFYNNNIIFILRLHKRSITHLLTFFVVLSVIS